MNLFKNINSVFLLLLSLIGLDAHSQEEVATPVVNPPINTEFLFSNRGMAFQMIIDKKFKSIPKMGFFSVTSLVGEWNDDTINDYMTQGSLTYEIAKGLKLAGGFHITPVKGMRPIAGLIYTKATRKWLFVANSRIDFSNDASAEGLILVEYKPQISKDWNFYSRLQGLYEHSTAIGKQTRSYLMARAGLSYKEFAFGLGSNIDYYGPAKHNENSYGVFGSALLF